MDDATASRRLIMTIFFLTLFAVVFAFAAEGLGFTSAAGEIALSAILGVVGTFVTQFIKKMAGANGHLALGLTVAVSAVLGFIAAWTVGEWDASDVIGSSAIVFSLATLAYRVLLSNDTVAPQVETAVDNATERVDGDGI
jgi:hypothetical protein